MFRVYIKHSLPSFLIYKQSERGRLLDISFFFCYKFMNALKATFRAHKATGCRTVLGGHVAALLVLN